MKTVLIDFVSGQYTSVILLELFGVSLNGDRANIDMVVVLALAADAIFNTDVASRVLSMRRAQ